MYHENFPSLGLVSHFDVEEHLLYHAGIFRVPRPSPASEMFLWKVLAAHPSLMLVLIAEEQSLCEVRFGLWADEEHAECRSPFSFLCLR